MQTTDILNTSMDHYKESVAYMNTHQYPYNVHTVYNCEDKYLAMQPILSQVCK